MFRRIIRGHVPPSRNNNPVFPECQTSQLEPNLREILVSYQRGEDVSDYVRLPATKATASQQFKNKFAKVDPLTELEQYVKKEVQAANEMVKKDRATNNKVMTTQEPKENPDKQSSE